MVRSSDHKIVALTFCFTISPLSSSSSIWRCGSRVSAIVPCSTIARLTRFALRFGRMADLVDEMSVPILAQQFVQGGRLRRRLTPALNVHFWPMALSRLRWSAYRSSLMTAAAEGRPNRTPGIRNAQMMMRSVVGRRRWFRWVSRSIAVPAACRQLAFCGQRMMPVWPSE